MKKIIAFDFDGTLTTRDTLLSFIRFACGTWAFLLGFLRYLPLLVLMKLRLYPNWKAKQKVFAHFFGGMALEDFDDLCRQFAATHRHLLRPEGIQALEQAREEGAEVLVVSASIDNWVQPFLPNGVTVLGTQVEAVDGLLTGRFLTPNCYGQEKVERILALHPDRASYHLTAYGDSRGDRELLAFADESHYKPFRPQFSIFKLSPEERVQAAIVLTVIILLNALFIHRLHPLFMQEGFGPYWKLFLSEFHLAGYDPLTYVGVTEWDFVYNVYRHPLLAFLIYPLYLLNQGLSALFGVNCVQYVVALPLIFCSFYSYLFLYRIQRRVIGLSRYDATLLSVFYFSFAYILLSVLVPDHFTISMFLLLLTLYFSTRSLLLAPCPFLLTAGVTLSNGVKVWLAELIASPRQFFHPKHLLLGVVLPAALLWSIAVWQDRAFIQPKEQARQEAKARQKQQAAERIAQMTPEQRQKIKVRQEKQAAWKRQQAAKSGKPMKQEGFWRWTDITTSRLNTVYENLFGESIQFHRQHFLEDTLVHRPVFVKYDWLFSYVVEAIILLLFVIGIWCGRRSRLLWMALSFFAFDMVIHLVLGFGINEIFIMAPHWLFALPIAVGCAFSVARGGWHRLLQLSVLALTCYLLVYNGWLLVDFLLSPVNVT